MSDMATDDRLRLHIEAIERLSEERAGINDDIKDRFALAKSEGYDVPTMRWALKERRIERQKREEQNALRETYGVQLGLF